MGAPLPALVPAPTQAGSSPAPSAPPTHYLLAVKELSCPFTRGQLTSQRGLKHCSQHPEPQLCSPWGSAWDQRRGPGLGEARGGVGALSGRSQVGFLEEGTSKLGFEGCREVRCVLTSISRSPAMFQTLIKITHASQPLGKQAAITETGHLSRARHEPSVGRHLGPGLKDSLTQKGPHPGAREGQMPSGVPGGDCRAVLRAGQGAEGRSGDRLHPHCPPSPGVPGPRRDLTHPSQKAQSP